MKCFIFTFKGIALVCATTFLFLVFISLSDAAPSWQSACNCGLRTQRKQSRIIGGRTAHITRWPWTAFLAHNKTGLYCGAALIAPSWLLTVSHCTMRRLVDNLEVVAGENYRLYPQSPTSQARKVAEVIRHEAYNETSHDNDIALIRVHTPFVFNEAVKPICLPHRHRLIRMREDYMNNQTAYVTGWGMTTTERLASTLQEVPLPISSTEACRKKFRHLRQRISENMICTHAPERDTCKGDSGGPLSWVDADTGRAYLVGITSWGKGCAQPDHPGFYTKVANYIPWIEAKTGSLCGV